jgi:hypothetical protein
MIPASSEKYVFHRALWTFLWHEFDIDSRLLTEKRIATELLESRPIWPKEIACITHIIAGMSCNQPNSNFCLGLIFLQPENLSLRSERSEMIVFLEMASLVRASNSWPMNDPI